MENNSIQQKNLAQSLQTDTLQQAITRYGDNYMAFLRKFPAPAKRKDYIRSVYDAVSREGMSLNSIDAYFGEGASVTWLKLMLTDLLKYLGAFDITTVGQIKGTAWRMRLLCANMTPSELTYFFMSFSVGDYGKLYAGRSVNPQDILIGLKGFKDNVFEQREIYEDAKQQRKREEEYEESKKNAVSYEEYCRMNGKDIKKSPLEKLKSKLEKESKVTLMAYVNKMA